MKHGILDQAVISRERVLAIARTVWEHGPRGLNSGALPLNGILRVISGLTLELFEVQRGHLFVYRDRRGASVLSCARPTDAENRTVFGAHLSQTAVTIEYHSFGSQGHSTMCRAITINHGRPITTTEVGMFTEGANYLDTRVVTMPRAMANLALVAAAMHRLRHTDGSTDVFGHVRAQSALIDAHGFDDAGATYITADLRRAVAAALDESDAESEAG